MPSSLDALALRPATTIASRPRLDATSDSAGDCHGVVCMLPVPASSTTTPRAPGIAFSIAAIARATSADGTATATQVASGFEASQLTQLDDLHVRKADPGDGERRRQRPKPLGGQHEVPSAPCSLHQVDCGRITGEVCVEEDVGGLVEGAAGQLDLLSAQRRPQVHVHRAGGTRARSAPGRARRHHERASTRALVLCRRHGHRHR